jgi:prepilin-type N-terminal cleavage/methylation domain-containing protein
MGFFKKNHGFTLIELLVVVLIVSILASLSLPQYFKVIERFRLIEATSAMSDIKKSEEIFLQRKSLYTDNFSNFDIEIESKDGNHCEGKICELKYFDIWVKILSDRRYIIVARRKSDPKPPSKYSLNYIYFYDSESSSFSCTDANCVRDFID